jgi:mannose-6-phosphate isomerase
MSDAIYPMKLAAVLHTRIWGGRDLGARFGKILPDDAPYGESWELHDSCLIANGIHAGKMLGQLVRELGTQMIGQHFNPAEGMPLLIKILDANAWLSVQVHPNDEQAKELEGDPRGKTEAWIVLHAEPQARLVVGVRPGTTRAGMKEAIHAGTLEALLVYAEVRKGDVFYMPANTIHALGPGIQIYEVQQSSDVTYRLYDWNRVGLDGKPRALHIDKGVQVSNIESVPHISHPIGEQMVSTSYFTTIRHVLRGAPEWVETNGHLQGVTCIEGEVTLEGAGETLTLTAAETAFIPAALPDFTLNGQGVVLRSLM